MGRRILWGYLLWTIVSCTPSLSEYEICFMCPQVDVVYMPEDNATKQDSRALKRAFKTCVLRGKCLVQFTVVEHGRYHAVCGSKEETICKREAE